MSEERNRTDLSEIIAESFGANATYVEGLLNRYRSNPSLVDEAWRTYFAELLGDSGAAAAGDVGSPAGGNGSAATAGPAAAAAGDGSAQTPAAEQGQQQPAAAQTTAGAEAQPAAAQPAAQPAVAAPPPQQVRGEAQPIRGGALKIVENMETSL